MPTEPDKRCGTCEHMAPAKHDFGVCKAPLPMLIKIESWPWADPKADATDCPCWQQKKEQAE